jgi:hypothetical protein
MTLSFFRQHFAITKANKACEIGWKTIVAKNSFDLDLLLSVEMKDHKKLYKEKINRELEYMRRTKNEMERNRSK